jgi:formate-dependent nitrite reductase membrane component NrfD
MIDAPSSAWFTAPPHWHWLIVLYFFFGGLAGGCYFIAALIDLFGAREDRRLARLGYYLAFPLVVLCGLLLTLDLTRPLRFWHMLIERNTFAPMFKAWSPMSVGSWALLVFGLFTFVSFLGALAEEEDQRIWPSLRRFRWPAMHAFRPRTLLGRTTAVLGGVVGFYVAGYTGVLLTVTNRPIWSDTPLLGMLFVVSAASTAAALLILLAHRWGWTMPGVASLHRMDDWVLALELIVLIAIMVSLGPVLRAWLNAWGVLLLLVIAGGIVAPLVLAWRARGARNWNMATPALLVLLGGFLLRLVIVFSSEAI